MRQARWLGAGGMWVLSVWGAGCASEQPGFVEEGGGDDDTVVETGSDVEVIFTEIMANPSGVSDSDGEWIEIYNAGKTDVDLEDFTVTDAGGDSFTIRGLTLSASDYAVLARSDKYEENGGVNADFDYKDDFTLANDAESLTLTDVDGKVVDFASYTLAPDGASLSLDPRSFEPSLNDDATNFCATPYSVMGDGDLGTPGEDNDACYIEASAGDLVFTEIMANPSAVDDAYGEYLEIYNTTSSPIKLDGWVLKDGNGGVHTVASQGELSIDAHGVLVFGRHFESSENGGIDVDYSWGDDLSLEDSAATIQIIGGETVVDEVSYGGSGFPATPEGASLQLDPEYPDATSNDDGANWCASTTELDGGDYGTPGAENISCSES